MAMVINSNIMSLSAQRNLSSSQAEQSQAMERLSSGLRINSAKDDAAGMAISSGLTSQVRGLNQAVRNANDGISLVQTAEGALQSTENILQRMRELAIQSANGTYQKGNRQNINAEVTQLKAEITRIAENTDFNGQKMLTGELGEIKLQVGSQANQTISMEIGSMDAYSLGGSGGDIVGNATKNGLATLQSIGTDSLVVNGQELSDLSAAADVKEAIKSINSDLDGYGAEVSIQAEVKAANVGTGVLRAGEDKLKLDLEDLDGNTSSYEITDTENMTDLIDKIGTETGGRITASVDDGRLVLTAEDGVKLTATETTDGASATASEKATGFNDGSTAGVQENNFSLVFNDTSADKRGVTIEAGGSPPAVDELGIDVHDAQGNINGVSVTTGSVGTVIAEGDLSINGVEVGEFKSGASAEESAANSIEAINDVSDQSGVVAYLVGTDQIGLRSTDGGEISIEYGENATDTDVLAMTGLQERNASAGVGSIANIDISTAEGAQKAIGVIDKAREEVISTRGDLGAINNRLDYTINNLTNVSKNAAASRSRIEDADFGAETAALARAQVLQQAGTAMLSQANAAPQQVLSLLR